MWRWAFSLKIKISKHYPEAQFPLEMPPFWLHSLDVKQVPLRTVLKNSVTICLYYLSKLKNCLKCIIHFPKQVQNFCQALNKPPKICQRFLKVCQVVKFRPIWSHCRIIRLVYSVTRFGKKEKSLAIFRLLPKFWTCLGNFLKFWFWPLCLNHFFWPLCYFGYHSLFPYKRCWKFLHQF